MHTRVGEGDWRLLDGSFWDDDAQCLVNAVNCVGEIEPGLDEEFARRWPEFAAHYQALCSDEGLQLGDVHAWNDRAGRWLVNLAVKVQPEDQARIDAIRIAVSHLAVFLVERAIPSVALPPIGCGLGGLHWDEVRPILEQHLEPLSDSISVRVYAPMTTAAD